MVIKTFSQTFTANSKSTEHILMHSMYLEGHECFGQVVHFIPARYPPAVLHTTVLLLISRHIRLNNQCESNTGTHELILNLAPTAVHVPHCHHRRIEWHQCCQGIPAHHALQSPHPLPRPSLLGAPLHSGHKDTAHQRAPQIICGEWCVVAGLAFQGPSR